MATNVQTSNNAKRPDSWRRTLMRDGQILDAPTPQARSLYERWQSLLEDLRDADVRDQSWLALLLHDDPHPVQVLDDGADEISVFTPQIEGC